MIPVIRTRTSGLGCTLRAMAVTSWSLTVDALHAIWVCNRILWRDYQTERERLRAMDRLFDGDQVDYCNGSVPRWLWVGVLVVCLAAALIDMAGGWQLLGEATGVLA